LKKNYFDDELGIVKEGKVMKFKGERGGGDNEIENSFYVFFI